MHCFSGNKRAKEKKAWTLAPLESRRETEEAQSSKGRKRKEAGTLAPSESSSETEEAQSSKGRKRKGEARAKRDTAKQAKTSSPFSVPPNKLTRKTFQFCNPFLRIASSDTWGPLPGDKVGDNYSMDADALETAILAMFAKQHTSSMAFKEASTEMGTRALHLAVAASFHIITSPHRVSTCASASEMAQQIDKAEEESKMHLNEDNEDLSIDVGAAFTTLTGRESNESLNVRHEGDDGEDEASVTKYDLNFLVHDKRVKGLDKKVTVLVVDCKHGNVSKGVWQVSTYGCKYAIPNMQKGRFDPIFLELWGDRLWRYAMLTPMGIVFIEDGQVSGSFGSSSSIEELNKKLLAVQKSYPGVRFPDGSYVDGLLYVSKKKLMLPDFATHDFTNVEGIRLFYQSKIRMIIGDNALKWTLDEVKNRIAVRKEQKKEACNDLEKALRASRGLKA